MVKNGSVFRLQEECLVNNFSEFSSSFGTIITEWREKKLASNYCHNVLECCHHKTKIRQLCVLGCLKKTRQYSRSWLLKSFYGKRSHKLRPGRAHFPRYRAPSLMFLNILSGETLVNKMYVLFLQASSMPKNEININEEVALI